MSNIIALGPSDVSMNQTTSTFLQNTSEIQQEQTDKGNMHFVDEIIINDKKILSIPLEHQFYDENEQKPQRKSRWGEKLDRKKVHTDVIFNPYLSLISQSNKLMIECGNQKQEEVIQNIQQQDDDSKSKWGEEYQKTFNPPPLNFIPSYINPDELEYILRLYRLDEVSKKLIIGEYFSNDQDLRSPSPQPIYDNKSGQRVNTRAKRYCEFMTREKHDLIEELKIMKPETFRPPTDYKPPKKSQKIYIPSDDPENNYIAMIIGPRGCTQKQLENKTNCQISIRGKGSNVNVKKGALDDDRLYILLQADTDEQLEKGSNCIERMLRGESEIMDEVKKGQQLQLMAITGVLRDDYCENCFEKGHRIWACPQKIVQKQVIQCQSCGDRSHVTIDCPFKQQFQARENLKRQQMLRDSNQKEYDFLRFLAEVEGENAVKLLNLVEKGKDVKAAPLPVNQRMAFITEYNPEQKLMLTNDSANSFGGSSGTMSRFELKGNSNLSMSKFLSSNLTEIQKNKAFQQNGDNIDQLFVRDTYLDTTPRNDLPASVIPQVPSGYMMVPEQQIQVRIIPPENYQPPNTNPILQSQIHQHIIKQNMTNLQIQQQSTNFNPLINNQQQQVQQQQQQQQVQQQQVQQQQLQQTNPLLDSLKIPMPVPLQNLQNIEQQKQN